VSTDPYHTFTITADTELYAVFVPAPPLYAVASGASSPYLTASGAAHWTWTPGGDQAYADVSGFEIEIFKVGTPSVAAASASVAGNGALTSLDIRRKLVDTAKDAAWGDGNYYFKVRAVSADVNKFASAPWSEASASQPVRSLVVPDTPALNYYSAASGSVTYTAAWDAAVDSAGYAVSSSAVSSYTLKLYYNNVPQEPAIENAVSPVDVTSYLTASGNNGTWRFGVIANDNGSLFYTSAEKMSNSAGVGENTAGSGGGDSGIDKDDFPANAGVATVRSDGAAFAANASVGNGTTAYPHVLSQVADDSISFTVTGTVSSLVWYVNGQEKYGTGNTLVFKAKDYQAGVYTVFVSAVIDGKPRSVSARVKVGL
jgi:hypothetical protein